MPQKTVLVAENLPLAREGLGACLQQHGFRARLAATPEEAADILNNDWVHAAIVDVRLRNDSDEKDFSGLELIGGSDSIIPTIIRTAYSETVLKELVERWLQGSALGAFAFRPGEYSTSSESCDALIEKLNKVLGNAKLDFELEIDDGFSFLSLAAEIEGPSRNRNYEAMGVAAAELEDLYRKLFWGRKSISIGWLPFGRRAEAFTLVQPVVETGPQGPLVVQCGRRETIKKIRDGWRSYLDPFLTEHAARLVGDAETLHYAGIVYQVTGPAADFRPLADRFRNNAPIEDILKVIQQIGRFWSTGGYQPATEALDALYRNSLRLNGKYSRFTYWMRRLLREYPARLIKMTSESSLVSLRISELSEQWFELPDRTESIFNFSERSLAEPAKPDLFGPGQPQLSMSHGNLSGDTVLAGPENQIWLMGSLQAGLGLFLRDFISLEAELVFSELERIPENKLDPVEPVLQTLTTLRAWLSPNALTDPVPVLESLSPKLKKVLAVTAALREAARASRSWPEPPDIRLYYGGLFFHALNDVLKMSETGIDLKLHEARARPAALAALLLADRLDRWPEWPLAIPKHGPEADQLRLKPPNQVFVPQQGWRKMQPRPFKMLEVLMAQPYQIVSRQTIIQAVWPDDESFDRGNALDQLVRRVREVIEAPGTAPDKCRYLVTHPYVGFELRADGRKQDQGS